MRKWQDLTAPDDPAGWYDVFAVWPTLRGTYQTADISATSDTKTVGASANLGYAYAFGVTTAGVEQEYVVFSGGGSLVVYEWDGTNFTSRLAIASAPSSIRDAVCMARYGDTALFSADAILGTGIYSASFGGAFGAIAGAPTNQNILVVQSNAVLAFRRGYNTWYASDVGDYTNWSTGEYATGTIYGSDKISAAVAHNNDVYVFKQGHIYRMTYVGGVVKWQVQLAHVGHGIPYVATASTSYPSQDWVISTPHGIVFYGGGGRIYLWDGVSEPRCINPVTTIPVETIAAVFTYDPVKDVLCVAPAGGSSAAGQTLNSGGSLITSLYYYYNFPMDAWGNGYGCDGELPATYQSSLCGVLRGEYFNRADASSKPVFWCSDSFLTGVFRRTAPTTVNVSGASCYVQTAMIGRSDRKTTFQRCTPLMRTRTSTSIPSLSLSLWRERFDTSAQSTTSVSLSTLRERFDMNLTDNFARFKISWTSPGTSQLLIEIDDVAINSVDAGTD